MRTSVFIATIGAASVLGGLVGGALVKLAGRNEHETRIAHLEQTLDSYANETLRTKKQIDDVNQTATIAKLQLDVAGLWPVNGQWWCGLADGAFCDRQEVECKRRNKVTDCIERRVAWCSVVAFQARKETCYSGRIACVVENGSCVGVE